MGCILANVWGGDRSVNWATAAFSRIGSLVRAGVMLTFCLASAMPVAAAPVPRAVLVLHQWEANLPWYGDFFSAFNGTIHADSPEPIAIYVEHLDLGRFKGAAHQESLHRYIAHKYSDRDIGIIISVGPAALPFAVAIRAEMWPEASLVFAAAMDATVAGLNLAADMTGSIVDLSPQEMIGTARALVPDLQRIVVLGDHWDDKDVHHAFKQELPAAAGKLDIADLTGLALPEIKRRVAVLPERTAILYTPIFVDGAGDAYLPGDALASVAEVANQPIVVHGETEVGDGAVGGVVIRPELTGADAAERVLRIMRGESASNIPLARAQFTTPVFDWRQLQRWKVGTDRLPAGSEIHSRPAGLWDQYHWHLSVAALAVVVQAALIGGLLVERRRRAVAELQSRRHFEEVAHLNRSAAVGVLSASLGHELNQPLGAVLSNAEAAELLLNSDPPDIEKVKAILADIRRDDQRAADVIRRLRALMGKSEPEPQLFDVNDVVRVITDILGAEAASRGVMLSADLDRHPLPARADPVHLQQVVLNLALNGMDAMLNRSAGRRHMIVTTALADAATIKVTVADSGTGIAPDKLKHIFEPFFTTKRQGMGLGLSIARTIIEQSGGRIWAENRADGGAVFSFTLPAAKGIAA
jgi:signal transduction histidine kinase